MKIDFEVVLKGDGRSGEDIRHRLEFTGFGNGLVVNPRRTENVNFSFSPSAVPLNRVVDDSGFTDSKWFAFWEADCAFPPVSIIRAMNFEEAYEAFVDKFVQVTDAEDLPANMEEYDGHFNSDGQPVNTEAVNGVEITLTKITLLDKEDVAALIAAETEAKIVEAEEQPLKSTDNDPRVKDEIRNVFEASDVYARFNAMGGTTDGIDIFFEHGQWFVRVTGDEDAGDRSEVTFSVVDADPGINGSGLDFEEL